MKPVEIEKPIEAIVQGSLGRRRFLAQAGVLGMGAAAAGLALGSTRRAWADRDSPAEAQQEAEQAKDTVKEIFTAALIAEDLATVFYYNGLVGGVIQDPALAGPGGSATDTAGGNPGNVNYLQAALTEEIVHANLFRSLLGISAPSADPVQTFYFPSGAFSTLVNFTGLLNALEDAFIGAYLNAIQEFATMSANTRWDGAFWWFRDKDNQKYTREQLDYFAKVAASILGIEAEHRVLGRVISNTNPANNLAYEQNDGLNAVYNGPSSAVAALTPFLTASTGPGYSLATALNKQGAVSLPVTGNPPAY